MQRTLNATEWLEFEIYTKMLAFLQKGHSESDLLRVGERGIKIAEWAIRDHRGTYLNRGSISASQSPNDDTLS